LNGKTEEEIISMIESGLEIMIQEEKQARLKALEVDQELGLQ
jgi:predicted RNase H-like HicB family nuclease